MFKKFKFIIKMQKILFLNLILNIVHLHLADASSKWGQWKQSKSTKEQHASAMTSLS